MGAYFVGLSLLNDHSDVLSSLLAQSLGMDFWICIPIHMTRCTQAHILWSAFSAMLLPNMCSLHALQWHEARLQCSMVDRAMTAAQQVGCRLTPTTQASRTYGCH